MMRCSDPRHDTDQVGGSGDGGAAPAGRTRPHTEVIDVERLAALLVAARAGSAGAFDRLIATCRPVVQRQARRSGDSGSTPAVNRLRPAG